MSNGIIGFDAYQGLFTKAQFTAGKGRNPGTVVNVQKDGDSKEFVAVKLASGNWSNGCLVAVDSAGVVGTATTVNTTASGLVGQRLGLLIFSSVSAIQTMAGTAYGYAQVFGKSAGQVVSATTVGMTLGIAGSAGVLSGQVIQSTATQMVLGINLIASASTQAFTAVFLNYPKYIPGPVDD